MRKTMRKTMSTFLTFLFLVFMISCKNEVHKEKENNNEITKEFNNTSPSELTITEKTIKKDSDGKIISNQEFNEYLASGEYLATPIIKDGKIVEAQLQKASKEQVQELMKMFENSSNEEIGKKAPDFEVKDLNGKIYKLTDLKNKTVVLNFWFTACKPCMIEIPELNELVKENKEVVFIGLATDNEKKVKSFLEKHPFNYHIIANAKDVADLYKVNSFPTHYIIKNGVVRNKFVGLSSDIKEKIQNAINGKNDSQKEVIQNNKKVSNKPIMLNSNSDIRNEKGKKLGMMDAVKMVNSQEYTMENAIDDNGNEYILIKKN